MPLIGAAIILVAAEQSVDLWSLARYIKSEHVGPCSRAGLTFALQTISDAVADMSDTESALDFIDPVFAYQVGVSNIGEVPGTSSDSGVRITSMWDPSLLLGCDREQYIGTVAFNGCLHLLHTAYSPLPNLLETTRAALISMCDERPDLTAHKSDGVQEASRRQMLFDPASGDNQTYYERI
jgi:hypothetical protein